MTAQLREMSEVFHCGVPSFADTRGSFIDIEALEANAFINIRDKTRLPQTLYSTLNHALTLAHCVGLREQPNVTYGDFFTGTRQHSHYARVTADQTLRLCQIDSVLGLRAFLQRSLVY